jgi:metal-responsive CopG/Arc/MetJ family transcriptional regulator
MKTAVSIPDPLFEAADNLAGRLGISRSELYARALARELASESDEAISILGSIGTLRRPNGKRSRNRGDPPGRTVVG